MGGVDEANKARRNSTELLISEELLRTLAVRRVRRKIGVAPTLALSAVRSVEETLGHRLPDAVWAWYAAEGRDPSEVLALTEQARKKRWLPRRYVAIDHAGETRSDFCVDLAPGARDTTAIVEWDGDRPTGWRWPDLAGFIRWRHDLGSGHGPYGAYPSEQTAVEQELESLVPQLVEWAVAPNSSDAVGQPGGPLGDGPMPDDTVRGRAQPGRP